MRINQKPLVRVAVAGLGAIGFTIAAKLDAGIPGIQLTAVSATDHDAARRRIANFRNAVPVMESGSLEQHADLVVECAPARVFANIATPFLESGKTVLAFSVGALLNHPELIQLAKKKQAQIIVPSGAILGLDAVAAAAEGTIEHARIVTRKPPAAFSGAPFIATQKIDLNAITTPLRIFAGTARQAVAAFPANANVAVVLALAGIGPDQTLIELWADPTVTRNIHAIEVKSDAANFSMTIDNTPSENLRTSKIAALSALAYLRKLQAPVRVGS